MSWRDFLKPIVLSDNRHYQGRRNHRLQVGINLTIYTILFVILYVLSNFNIVFVLFWLGGVLYMLIYYATADRVSDKIGYGISKRFLGESKIHSDPETHEAIKQLEINSNGANEQAVKKAVLK